MSFEKLISKVAQAEDALEARERQVSADVRQFRRTWRAAWTPGRIVMAGLASGFLVGRSGPLRAPKGSSVMQMLSMLSTLLASTSAQAAAHEAGDAADEAEGAAEDLSRASVSGSAPR